MVPTTPPSAAAPGGVVESALAPLSGTGPVAPVESAVSWVMLAAARRELGTPTGAQRIPAAAVPTGPLPDIDAVPSRAAERSAILAPAAAEGSVVQVIDPVASATATNPIAAFFEQIGAFVNQIVTAITQVITQVVSAITNIFSPAPANKIPVAAAPPTVGTPNAATGVVTGTVTATDPDGDTVTYSAPANTAKGTVVIDAATGEFVYTPTSSARHAAAALTAAESQRADTFTVTVTDERGGKATIAVNVAVSPSNAAPVAGTAVVGSPNDSTGVVTGTLSATDADGDALTYSGSTTTSKGAVVVNANGSFTYTPTATARHAAARTGADAGDLTDFFTVIAVDGYGGSASAVVTVVVSPSNAAPVAGTAVVGSPNDSTGVVTGTLNATDADGDALTYSGSTTTSKGAVVVNANGSFTYTPTATARHAAARTGADAGDLTDFFTVIAVDGYGGSASAVVTVVVSPSNAAPVAGTAVVGSPNDSTGVVTGTLNATDADGDALTYSGSTTTSKGAVVVNANGSFTYTPTAEAQRNAALPGTAAASLSDTFLVTVIDGYGGSISVPVEVSVNPLVSYYVTGDVRRDPVTGRLALRTIFPPEQAQPGTGTPGYLNWLIATTNSGALTGFPADVQNWDNLFLVGSAEPVTPFNPAVTYPEGTALRNPQTGAVAIRTIFPEDQGPNLANMAWLVATTSQGGLNVPTSSVQTWDVLFAPNRAPVAGSPVVGTPDISTGVVTGSVSATDPDGDDLTYSGSITTPKGSVTVAASGSFTYTPTATARQNAGKTGATAADKTDNFTVAVTDGNGGTVGVPVEVVIRSLPKTGDIIQQPGGTWRAVYAPNVTSWGSNWLGVNPGNGGVWLSDSDVYGWLDVVPPTGAETTGSGPYSAGDIKVPPGSVEGSMTWFAVKTGAPLSDSYSWMTCSVTSACNTASDNDVIAGSPIVQWVDLPLSR